MNDQHFHSVSAQLVESGWDYWFVRRLEELAVLKFKSAGVGDIDSLIEARVFFAMIAEIRQEIRRSKAEHDKTLTGQPSHHHST